MAEKKTCSTQTNPLRRQAEEKAALMIETPQAFPRTLPLSFWSVKASFSISLIRLKEADICS